MSKKSRFIKSIIATARSEHVDMPWARGARRGDMIARRTAALAPKKRRLALA